MNLLKVELLKKIIENLPDNFGVEFYDGKKTHKLSKEIRLDYENNKLVFTKY